MKILVADDHPIFRKGVVSFLKADFPDAEVFQAADGEKALAIISDLEVDVAFLDIDMPQLNGLEVCAKVKRLDLPTKIIILTIYKDVEILRKALTYHVAGYLIKENTSEEIKECINTIIKGERFITTSLRYIDKFPAHESAEKQLMDKFKTLTSSEFKTLCLVSEKMASREIADLLFVTLKSVENYRYRICKKLSIPSGNNSLLLWAIENKTTIDKFKEIDRIVP